MLSMDLINLLLDNVNHTVHKWCMATTIGRPLEFDPDTALEKAMQLFWVQGYEHTSMQDLLVAMNLSKSSLYQAFGSKQQLFRRCIARYADFISGRLRDGLNNAPTGCRFIESFLYSVIGDGEAQIERRGCLVMNTASEFAQNEADISKDVADSIERFHGVLQAAVERAQQEGDIAPERDARQLANFLVNSMSGLKVQAKAGADGETLKSIIEVVLKALK